MSSKKEKTIYQIPDEAIRNKLIGDADLQEAFHNRVFQKKKSKKIDIPNGVITVINQTNQDLRRRFSDWTGEKYDIYVADQHYLDKDEVAYRIEIVDKGRTDWMYDAKPAIDWVAPELTTEQVYTRLLFLASLADQVFADESIIREIIAFLPKTQNGEIKLNHVTRIASANIVTQEAKVLEMVARVKSKAEVTISVEYRPFSRDELKMIEEDFFSQHVSLFGWDQIPEIPQKETTDEIKSVITEKISRYMPEPKGWEEPPEWNPSFQKYVNPKRYEGITLWFCSVWEVAQKGYSYENSVDSVEKLIFNSGHLWAPLEYGWSFPLEKPSETAKVKLGKLDVHIMEGAKSYSSSTNRFIFLVDQACIKDAIRRRDTSLLRERTRFLSVDNIDACINFAQEEKAEECVEWLERQCEIVKKQAEEMIVEIEEPDEDTLRQLKDTEEWMNRFGYALERNPEIVFEGKIYVFSGFGTYFGEPNNASVQAVIARGGLYRTKVSGKTDYVVANPAYAGWSKAGNAIDYQEDGKNVQIILEQDLLAALGEITWDQAEKEKAFLYSLIKPENLTKPVEEEDEDEEDDWDDFDFDFELDEEDEEYDERIEKETNSKRLKPATRQARILRMIQEEDFSTPRELVQWFTEQGYKVSESMITRDIKSLHIMKIPKGEGGYRYVTEEMLKNEQKKSEKKQIKDKNDEALLEEIVTKKNPRQEMLLKLISEEKIGTQGDLVRRLNEEGFHVTQATVSRDLNVLQVIKIPQDTGGYRYGVESKHIAESENNPEKPLSIETKTAIIKRNPRQEMLLKLISEEKIGTQGDLVRRLNEEGFHVTQATVSRDLNALHVIKIPQDTGEYRYSIESKHVVEGGKIRRSH